MEKIIIAGSVFRVEDDGFVNLRNKDIVLPFSAFHREPELAKLYLDLTTLKHIPLHLVPSMESKALKITVPVDVMQKGFKLSFEYADRLNKKSYKNGWNVLGFDKWIYSRLEGLPPRMSLHGKQYQVMLNEGMLKSFSDHSSIALHSTIFPKEKAIDSHSETGRSFWYNTDIRKEVDLDFRATVLPKDIILVTLPSDKALDPIGMAKMNGLEATTFLHQYPARGETVARCIPISQTNFIDVIRRNQVAQDKLDKQDKQEKEKRSSGMFWRRGRKNTD